MAVFLFSSLAILAFWIWADKKLLKQLFPICITAVFIRFLEHFIVIDWLHIWVLHGSKWKTLFLPIIADVTIWPVACYLYIQKLPKRLSFWYVSGWVALMFCYLLILLRLGVFSMHKGWTVYDSILVLYSYFFSLRLIWYWLSGPHPSKKRKGGVNHG